MKTDFKLHLCVDNVSFGVNVRALGRALAQILHICTYLL